MGYVLYCVNSVARFIHRGGAARYKHCFVVYILYYVLLCFRRNGQIFFGRYGGCVVYNVRSAKQRRTAVPKLPHKIFCKAPCGGFAVAFVNPCLHGALPACGAYLLICKRIIYCKVKVALAGAQQQKKRTGRGG